MIRSRLFLTLGMFTSLQFKRQKQILLIPSISQGGRSFTQEHPTQDTTEWASLYPLLTPSCYYFLAHSLQIYENSIHTKPHPSTVFSTYVPCALVAREEFFWFQQDTIFTDHPNSSHVAILGDYNARLDCYRDPDQGRIGSHVWGRRPSIGFKEETMHCIY